MDLLRKFLTSEKQEAGRNQTSQNTDLFLTHDWGKDELERPNHDRVRIIANELREEGYRCWFDEKYMTGDIRDRMREGIDGTQAVVVFLTKRYMDKVNSGVKTDNCRMEFNYAFDKNKPILCVTMDKTMSTPSEWDGTLKLMLGNVYFVRLDEDLNNKEYLKERVAEVIEQLKRMGIEPNCPQTPRMDITTNCGNKPGQEETMYCGSCKTQRNGVFCNSCGTKLRVSQNERENILNETIECTHYLRRCQLVSPCCGKVYPCRLCHDDEEDHQLDRKAVTNIVCVKCYTKQPLAANCTECGTSFGSYSCLICRLFDDNDKQQFHCEGCGICRVYGRENFYHCPKCNLCISKDIWDDHNCLKDIAKRDCPVCMKDLHSSRKEMHIPKCSHMIHSDCLEKMFQEGNYKCPTCNKNFK